MNDKMSRRTALGVIGGVTIGCADDADPDGAGGNGGTSGVTTGAGPTTSATTGAGATTNASATAASTTQASTNAASSSSTGGQVDACGDDPAMTAEAKLAEVDTIVVLMMENRSFDHYFGSLQLLEGKMVDGLDGTEQNPDPAGNPVLVHQLDDFTPEDPPHGWDASHRQWNNGMNDGFVTEHEGSAQEDVMGYHVRAQIPTFYALVDAYAICDRWFASVMGPTWPNRFYLHGGSSNGQQGNSPVFGFKNIFDVLADANVASTNFNHGIAWATGGYAKLGGLASMDTFFDQAEAGTLPQFSIIDPNFFGAGANDDHPDHDIQLGQALIASIYAALAASPQWQKMMFVIIYDEHGGFFDHVPPPTTDDERDAFRQLGFRIPALVISPFAKKGCVVSTQFDHTSVIKTLCVKFGLEQWNERIMAANDLSSALNPAYFSDPQDPIDLPPITISLSRVRARPATRSHPELADALDRMQLPPQLDRRAESDAITERLLRRGAALGAIDLVD